MGDAPCRGLGWLFFSEDEQSVDRAKEICAGCRRSATCLSGALDRREACGVWGGELLRFGEVLPGVPKRGRPRKVAA
jgi:WhiB family redox-sensing transcriptional regulator